jgi:hypothetical protein
MFISYQPPHVKEARACSKGWLVANNLPTERIARGISSCIWSPIVWDGGRRKSANFLRAAWIALDFDDTLPLAEALNIWCDAIHIIGTTKSHGIKGERFRVVLKLAETCTDGRDFEQTTRTIAGSYDGDLATADAGRLFYPCKEIVSVVDEGYTQDLHKAPPPVVYAPRERGTRIIPSRTLKLLKFQVVPVGERNGWCFGTAKDLAWAGYSIDETMALILESPTYRDGSPPVREISQAVTSGFKSAAQEAASGQEEEA